MLVAESAVSAPQQHDPLLWAGQVGQHALPVVVEDLCADRHRQHEVATIGAGAVRAGAAAPVLRPKMLPITIVDQRVQIIGGLKDDVAALAAVTAVRSAELDEFL